VHAAKSFVKWLRNYLTRDNIISSDFLSIAYKEIKKCRVKAGVGLNKELQKEDFKAG